ncbi:hypothetical protein VOLCADRAFT_105603, partial [Volvox carteri f. nagariensis]
RAEEGRRGKRDGKKRQDPGAGASLPGGQHQRGRGRETSPERASGPQKGRRGWAPEGQGRTEVR